MKCAVILYLRVLVGLQPLVVTFTINFFAFFFLILDEREKLEGLELLYHPAPGSDKAQIK